MKMRYALALAAGILGSLFFLACKALPPPEAPVEPVFEEPVLPEVEDPSPPLEDEPPEAELFPEAPEDGTIDSLEEPTVYLAEAYTPEPSPPEEEVPAGLPEPPPVEFPAPTETEAPPDLETLTEAETGVEPDLAVEGDSSGPGAAPAVPLPPAAAPPAASPLAAAPVEAAPPPAGETTPPEPPRFIRPAEPAPQAPPVERETPVMPVSPPPEPPAVRPPALGDEELVYSRTVRMTLGQILEIPFRGAGWVYLGELNSRRGMTYLSRRSDEEGQIFVLRADEPGTFELKFYKQDFIRDYILNDYVRVIAGPAPETGDWFSPPIEPGRVVAEPRWPRTGDSFLPGGGANSGEGLSAGGSVPALRDAAADTALSAGSTATPVENAAAPPAAGATGPSAIAPSAGMPGASATAAGTTGASPALPAAGTPGPSTPSAGMPESSAPAAGTAGASPAAPAAGTAGPSAAARRSPAESAPGPSLPRGRDDGIVPVAPPAAAGGGFRPGASAGAGETEPDGYLRQVREEHRAGRISAALSLLDQFRTRFPAGSDEAWWLYGQLLEAEGPDRDIRSALDYYRRLIREYPQSPRYDDARRRIAYLERYYFSIP